MVKTENFEKVEVTSKEELRDWLEQHHNQEKSIWLVTYKKHIEDKYVSVSEILDEILCVGWIDGVRRKLDLDRTMQLIGPRKAQHWTKTYKDRAAKLEEEGRMKEAGRAAIRLSKENELWTFMDDVDALVKPDDLIKALEEHPPAMTFFNGMGDSSKRFVMRWIKLAKTEKTRAKRILQTAELAQQGKKIPGI